MRIFILFFLSLSVGFAQNNVSGLVVNQDGKPVQNALVQAPELALQTQSDENGSFVLNISSAALLTVSADSYQTYVTEVTPGEVITISLVSALVDDLDQFSESMSLITLSDDELSEDDQAADNISGLLQSSRDVFLRTAAYEFSSSFFRVRGLDSDLGSVRMNGVPMNKFFNGRPQWSNWGGLNDLMRNQEFNA
ncbi:MAG: carboxypeptidase regulatory-like domain-containing protein, partial [Flavobacteriaceae bacterium]